MEYRICSCLGVENVQLAIEEKINEDARWRVHSITPSGLQQHAHPLQPGKAIAIMTFIVLFEMELFDA